MTKTHIEPIPVLPFGMVNAFLLVRGKAAVLIDTGLPNSEPRVEAALRKHGLGWRDIRLIVLTHAHNDHAGSAVALRALTSAPILAHEREVSYCNGAPPVFHPTGMFGRLFYRTGAIQRPFPYFTPDQIMTTSELSLDSHGIPARVVWTPGHTPGSVSVELDEGRVIAGDLAASGVFLGGLVLRQRPKRPPFEEDAQAVAHSLDLLLTRGGQRFYLGHGGPLGADTIRRHVARLRRLGH